MIHLYFAWLLMRTFGVGVAIEVDAPATAGVPAFVDPLSGEAELVEVGATSATGVGVTGRMNPTSTIRSRVGS